MGLSLAVGCSSAEADDYGPVSAALIAAGLKPHDEPSLDEAAWFSADMWGYSGLHSVRRIAAYLALGIEVPGPCTERPAADPAVRKYYSIVAPGPLARLSRWLRRAQPTGKLGFGHLMLHSDADGFYVPQDFPDVLFPDVRLRVPGGMIGSSQRLAEECRQIAAWLDIPPDLDHEAEEVWQAAEEGAATGPKWKRFGRETFGCLRLLRAAEHSVRTRAALVFC